MVPLTILMTLFLRVGFRTNPTIVEVDSSLCVFGRDVIFWWASKVWKMKKGEQLESILLVLSLSFHLATSCMTCDKCHEAADLPEVGKKKLMMRDEKGRKDGERDAWGSEKRKENVFMFHLLINMIMQYLQIVTIKRKLFSSTFLYFNFLPLLPLVTLYVEEGEKAENRTWNKWWWSDFLKTYKKFCCITLQNVHERNWCVLVIPSTFHQVFNFVINNLILYPAINVTRWNWIIDTWVGGWGHKHEN